MVQKHTHGLLIELVQLNGSLKDAVCHTHNTDEYVNVIYNNRNDLAVLSILLDSEFYSALVKLGHHSQTVMLYGIQYLPLMHSFDSFYCKINIS